jgi:S-methylmethionine-dependent homocysteine/selenocysteine methylase
MKKNIPHPLLPNRTILLDGGMGRELRFRGVEIPKTIRSANGLLGAPNVVRQIHMDYILAGADIITTNTYALVRTDLAKTGIESLFGELNMLAGKLAQRAREASGRSVLIAGSLPPLRGSYRPDLVGPFEEIEYLYREQANLLAPFVDLLLCETMSSGAEARAAAYAACSTGKPVWVSWTLHEDRSGRLRSGETITEAAAAIDDLPVSAFLLSCSAPESITAGMQELKSLGAHWFGGYANTFQPIARDWLISGDKDTDGFLSLRYDLEPAQYSEHAQRWVAAGARVIGGCCGTRPAHIAKLREIISLSSISRKSPPT